MQRKKLDVFVAFFCYSGNGGIASSLPEIGFWWADTFAKMNVDERIGRVKYMKLTDTPIPMTRNDAVCQAIEEGYDLILMVDSDNEPDMYLGIDPEAVPFWDSSFEFLYNLPDDQPALVAAPYCGPPPHPTKGGEEVPYAFLWKSRESDVENPAFTIEMYSRNQAAQMAGIHPAAACATGLILYKLNCFQHIEPPYFYYEWTDRYQRKKASTEDCTNTRDISLGVQKALGVEAVHINWSAWAGHHKSKCVGKPVPIYTEQVGKRYDDAKKDNISINDRLYYLRLPDGLTESDFPPAKSELPRDLETEGESGTDEPTTEKAAEPALQKTEEIQLPPGVEVIKRRIGDRVVKSVCHQTHPTELNALTSIVHFQARRIAPRPLRIIEVGSWVGESAIAMVNGFGPHGGCVYCVEHFLGSEMDEMAVFADKLGPETIKAFFTENCGELLGKEIRLIEGKSLHHAQRLPPQGVDLVFIDAEHDYASVKLDILAWLKHCGDQALMIGHDYSDGFPGVKSAVDEIFGSSAKVIGETSIWMVDIAKFREKPQNVDIKSKTAVKVPLPPEGAVK